MDLICDYIGVTLLCLVVFALGVVAALFGVRLCRPRRSISEQSVYSTQIEYGEVDDP